MLLAAGMASLWAYASAPGPIEDAPCVWPRASSIPRSESRPTLVMWVHPRCPCSRASLSELAIVLSRWGDRVDAHILFVRDAELEPEWSQTDLWESAAAMDGVAVGEDINGVEATRFGAMTSGTVVIYGANGRLQFQGGVTAARGHAGSNDGRSAVEDILSTGRCEQTRAFTFGCELFTPGRPAAKENVTRP